MKRQGTRRERERTRRIHTNKDEYRDSDSDRDRDEDGDGDINDSRIGASAIQAHIWGRRNGIRFPANGY